MAEMRRPNRDVPSRAAAGASRRSSPQPQRKPTPKLVWIGLAVAVIVIIGLVWNLVQPGSSAPEEKVVTVDHNSRIKELEKQVPSLISDYNAWRKLMVAEDSSAKGKQETLKHRIENWMQEWDGIFEPKRDADNKFPPELQGYQSTRSRINQLRSDLAKSSGL
jgi:hypothetical protein